MKVKIKTKRDNITGIIMLQLNGNTLGCLWKERDRFGTYYESDTFSQNFKTIAEAKKFYEKKVREGYFGEVFLQSV